MRTPRRAAGGSAPRSSPASSASSRRRSRSVPAPRSRAALLALAVASLAPAATAQDPAAASPPGANWSEAPPDHWPHKVSGPSGSAMVYEPQVISWSGRQQLDTRIALGILPNGATKPALGTIEVAFATSTD